MPIKIYADMALKTDKNYIGSITEYSTFKLTLLLPAIATDSVYYSWISPTNLRFAERIMARDLALDEFENNWIPSTEQDWNDAFAQGRGYTYTTAEGLPDPETLEVGDYARVGEPGLYAYYAIDKTQLQWAYSATVYPVMTAGLSAQQTSGKSLFSFRMGATLSPIIKISVDKSIFPEQTEIPQTISDDLLDLINQNITDIGQLQTDTTSNSSSIVDLFNFKADKTYVDDELAAKVNNKSLSAATEVLIDEDRVDIVAPIGEIVVDDLIIDGVVLNINSSIVELNGTLLRLNTDATFYEGAKYNTDKALFFPTELTHKAYVDGLAATKQDADYSTYATKTILTPADVLALNDSEAAGTLKKTTIQSIIDLVSIGVGDFGFVKVTELPAVGLTNKIYLVPDTTPETGNVLEEYIYIDDAWELIGNLDVDLSDYYTITEVDTLLSGKADTVHTHTESDITDLDKYTQNEVDTLLDNKVDVGTRYAGATTQPTYTDNGDGTLDLNPFDVNFYTNANFSGNIVRHSFGFFGVALTDQATNYIVGDYNNGTPIIRVTTNVEEINESNIIPIFTIVRTGNVLHELDWDSLGLGRAEKIHQRLVKTQRFARETGLSFAVPGTTRTIVADSGIVWYGATRKPIDAVDSAIDSMRFYYHNAGQWTSQLVTQFPNTQYDNGTNLATLGVNRYAVIWVFRGVETQKHLYFVLGTGDYTLNQAQVATVPPLPFTITSHAILIGKIIIQESTNTPLQVSSAFERQFGFTPVSVHGDLAGREEADQHPIGAITGLQAALDGKADNANIPTEAIEINYNNTTSGLAATNTQAAIDEVAGLVDGIETLLAAI